jgi:hypothetical protein
MKSLKPALAGWLAAAAVAACGPSAQATTILFSDLGPGQSYNCCQGYLVGKGPIGSVAVPANSFVASASGPVSEIDVAFQQVVGSDSAVVSLWTNGGNALGTELGSWTVSGFPLLASIGAGGLSTITGISGITLTAGDTYYLQIMYNAPGYGGWPFNSQGVTGNVLESGSPAGTDLTGAFDVLAAGVPEPATWAMLSLGVAMIGCAARRRSRGASSAFAAVPASERLRAGAPDIEFAGVDAAMKGARAQMARRAARTTWSPCFRTYSANA